MIDNYLLTARYAAKRIEDETTLAMANDRDLAELARLMECRPDIMEKALSYLDSRYGGVERCLLQIGLSDSALASLRRSLVEYS